MVSLFQMPVLVAVLNNLIKSNKVNRLIEFPTQGKMNSYTILTGMHVQKYVLKHLGQKVIFTK